MKRADDETVARVVAGAESGSLRNFLDGEYRSRGRIDILAYRTNVAEYLPGTSVLGTRPGTASGKPETVTVEDLTLPVGTRDAVVPRGYLLPAALSEVVAKLRAHNVTVRTLDRATRFDGDAFTISTVRKVRRSGYDMTTLDGAFLPQGAREFPVGTFLVDMAQPMANAAFYYLEPQARDGFVGWGVLDRWLSPSSEYPVFKYRRESK